MAAECCLSRKLQVRKRGHTGSTVGRLDKTESRGQDTMPVSKEQSNNPVRNPSLEGRVPSISSTGPTRLTQQGRPSGRSAVGEVHKPTSSLICGAKAKLVRGLVIRVGSQPFLIKSRPIQLKSETQMTKLSSEHL